jgi:hypothetical protein
MISPNKHKYQKSIEKIRQFRDESPLPDYGLRKKIKSTFHRPMVSAMGLEQAQFTGSKMLMNNGEQTF